MTEYLLFMEQWGPWVVLLGAFLEGEFTLLAVCYAVSRSQLSAVWVVMAGFMGAFIGDWLAFELGKRGWGQRIWRIPWLAARRDRIGHALERRPMLSIVVMRFQVALRNLGCMMSAHAGMKRAPFLRAIALADAIWVAVIVTFSIQIAPVLTWLIEIWSQIL